MARTTTTVWRCVSHWAIPTYNRSSCLARLLDSIIQQENYCHDELEVIVCDNASTDET
ncbi:glycosyltransferase, partial [Salmonella enterica subsp. enterica serovar Kentucky]|nr:glycosyltransferase [Salmonella enterica subsp. enterica serovar Kentucky]